MKTGTSILPEKQAGTRLRMPNGGPKRENKRGQRAYHCLQVKEDRSKVEVRGEVTGGQ